MKILVLLLLSFSAFASEQNTILQKLSTGTLPADVLKEFHQSKGTAPGLDEVNSLNVDTGDFTRVYANCVGTDYSYPLRLDKSYFHLIRVNKVIAATPPNGPLFPGTPQRIVPLVSFDSYGGPNVLNAILMGEKTVASSSETNGLIIHINATNFSQNHVEIKKHGDLLSFYMSLKDGTGSTHETYGYCWNE